MKLHKIYLIIVLLLLLSGCAVIELLSDLAEDSGAPSSSASVSRDNGESEGISEPVKNEPEKSEAPVQSSAEQEQASEPEKAPEPEDTLYSGVLRVSNEERASNVGVFHVADDGFNSPELAEYEVIGLSDFESYHEFVDSYDVASRILFMASSPVKDFHYLQIETVSDDAIGVVIVDTLYRLDALTPEKPFVVNWISIGDIGMFRGISFVDETGMTRYFGFNISGYDGDVYLIEFQPE